MVLFLIASGIKIGIGHVKRCVQLASDLREQNVEVLLCLENDFQSIEIIKRSGLNVSVLASENQLKDVFKTHPEIKVAVLDMLSISHEYTQRLKEINPKLKLLALDYFDMLDINVNTIINLYNHNKEYSKPVNPSVKYLEGPEYGILRSEFQSLLLKEKAIPKTSFKNILVTFGGSDPKKHTLSVIPLLNSIIQDTSILLTIVIGPNFLHADEIREAVKKIKLKHELIVNPPDMAQLMNKADLCICGSGTTIMELCALGTPALVIPQSPEELRFSGLFATAGFATIVGSPGSIDVDKLRSIINDYQNDPDKLTHASAIGPTLCDGKGKKKIIHEIITLLNN